MKLPVDNNLFMVNLLMLSEVQMFLGMNAKIFGD
jgi:hypothetical protein